MSQSAPGKVDSLCAHCFPETVENCGKSSWWSVLGIRQVTHTDRTLDALQCGETRTCIITSISIEEYGKYLG